MLRSPHGALLRELLPPVSYDPAGALVAESCEADGLTLDLVYATALEILRGLAPLESVEWLPDYERVYGLPDECTPEGADLDLRLRQLAIALRERRGISREYYYWLAAVLGYEISVEEYLPFVAGSRAGEGLYNSDWYYAWLIRATGTGVRHFAAGRGCAGDPLQSWGDGLFECVFRRLAPAHTLVHFAYGDSRLGESAPGECLACQGL